jgi:hypothetical protein
MSKLLTTVLLSVTFLLSCSNNDRQKKGRVTKDTTSAIIKHKDTDTIINAGYFKIDKDSITVLPFEIDVSLSPKAKKKIISSNETMIINVSLSGIPKDEKLYSEDGQFYVASSEKEITYGQLAKFDNIKFSRKVYDQLTGKDVEVTAFVYSGRKSSKDNLLTGDLLSGRISDVVNKKFTLKCKLIYGDD